MFSQREAELQREIELVKAELEEYRTLLDTIPVMFWYKDTSNRYIRVNKAGAALDGMTPEALEGKFNHHVVPKEIADAFYKDDMAVIESGEPRLNIIEKHISRQSDEVKWLQTGKVPYYGNTSTIKGVIAFAIDITAQKMAEEALQKKTQELQRIHEIVRSTLEQLTDAVKRDADAEELLNYLSALQSQFTSIESEQA